MAAGHPSGRGPEKEAAAKAKEVEKWQGAEGRLRDLEEQLKYAPQTLEDAQEDLARARARGEEDPERMKALQSAENFLKSRQGDIDRLKAGIEKAKWRWKRPRSNCPRRSRLRKPPAST
jgi:multidrug resistance efflux pump